MKLLRRTALILLAVASALLLAAGALLYTGKADYAVYRIESSSMAPGIPEGAIVVVDKDAEIEEGDVISFYAVDDHVTTHRLVQVNEDGTIETQGDALDQVDPSDNTTDDIIGEVVGVYPGLGAVVDYLMTPKGFASAVLVIAAGGFLLSAVTGRKEDEDDEHGDDDNDDVSTDTKELVLTA